MCSWPSALLGMCLHAGESVPIAPQVDEMKRYCGLKLRAELQKPKPDVLKVRPRVIVFGIGDLR